jgi:hypothetical protein
MRIVIEIDPSGADDQARPRVSGLPATARAEVADAAAETPLAAPIPEASAELLARGAALNALNAGPAPGLIAPSKQQTAALQAESPADVAEWARESDAPPPCGALVMQEGGITNAGPAPT